MMTRCKNLTLFIRAYLAACTKRRSKSESPERILVVPAGKLGDVVCTTPVMRAVRKSFPHAKLYVRENGGVNEALLRDSGLADGYIQFGSMDQYVRELRQEQIDTLLITGPSLEDVSAALLAGVPRIIAPHVVGGYCPQQTRTYLALLRFTSTYPYAMEAYAPRERLRCLEPLGVQVEDTTKHLGFSEKARATRTQLLQERGLKESSYAVISPGAGNKIKEWPPERFAEVAKYLVGRGMPVVVIGSVRDREEVAAMKDFLPENAPIFDVSEKLSLDELKAVIASAALFVSVDTGPIYIAEAFGIPTVNIVGPVDERVQPPRGRLHLVVVPPGRKKAELFIMNSRSYNAAEAIRQVNSITVQAVTDSIDTLLKEMKLSI